MMTRLKREDVDIVIEERKRMLLNDSNMNIVNLNRSAIVIDITTVRDTVTQNEGEDTEDHHPDHGQGRGQNRHPQEIPYHLLDLSLHRQCPHTAVQAINADRDHDHGHDHGHDHDHTHTHDLGRTQDLLADPDPDQGRSHYLGLRPEKDMEVAPKDVNIESTAVLVQGHGVEVTVQADLIAVIIIAGLVIAIEVEITIVIVIVIVIIIAVVIAVDPDHLNDNPAIILHIRATAKKLHLHVQKQSCIEVNINQDLLLLKTIILPDLLAQLRR